MAESSTSQKARSTPLDKLELNSLATHGSVLFCAVSPRIGGVLRCTIDLLIASTRGVAISLIVAVQLLAPTMSRAATYYVAPTGSDSASGTAISPFESIQKAVDVINPGDVVIVKDGIYTSAGSRYPDRVIQFNRGGTAAAWVTVKAENQYGAILDGQNYSTIYGAVFFNSYINFDGFEIRNFKNAGLWMQGTASGVQTHDLVITRNWIHHIARVMIADCTDGGGRVGAFANGYVYKVKWDRNLIHDIGRIPNLACDANLSTTPNYRHDHGLYLQGKYHTVTNNIFYNMYAGWAIKVDGFYLPLTNPSDASHVIRNNTFAFPSVPRETTGHIRFFSNDSGGGQPETDSGNTMQKAINVIVENNISYQPPVNAGETSAGPTMIAIMSNGLNPYVGTVVRDNLTTVGSVVEEAYGGTEISAKVTLSGNLVSTNPLLVNTGANDFHLTGSSAAIGAGVAPMPAVDFAGTARTTNDVGAYQHTGTLPPPSGLRVVAP